MRTLLEELIRRLTQEFSADNIGSAATFAHEASWNTPAPLGLFVVSTVLRHLEDQWDISTLGDQGWMTAEALADMEDRLRPPLLDYLGHLNASPLECADELRLLNVFVDALFKWTAQGPDPRPSPN